MLSMLLLFVTPAGAWGPAGHKAVALIAQKWLTPVAQAKITELLGKGVGLDRIASCANHLRDQAASVPCANFILPYTEDTTNWHIQGIPLSEPTIPLDIDGFCLPNGGCPSMQIRRQLAVLKNVDSTKAQRQVALAFVVHLVADIHQPLHCAMDVDTGPYRKRFGNTRMVTYRGEKVSLHHLWDNVLENTPKAERLNRDPGPLVSLVEREVGVQPTQFRAGGDPIREAIGESFRYSKTEIYPDSPPGAKLGSKYAQKMSAIAYLRIELAGLRLAAMLNNALQ